MTTHLSLSSQKNNKQRPYCDAAPVCPQTPRGAGQQLTTAKAKLSEKFRRVTNVVLFVSIAFLASIFSPAANTMMRILNPQWEWLDITDDVCSILWDFNYAVNFYLYVITGRVVRVELLQMMKCGAEDSESRKRVHTGVYSVQMTSEAV